MYVEKYIIRKYSGISTVSTACGQSFTMGLDNLSTCYPQSVDKEDIHSVLLSVKTQI